MKRLEILKYPEQNPEAPRTNSVPVDGSYTILDVRPEGVAIRFTDTGNVAILSVGDVIHDRVKRAKSGDAEYWYSVAVNLRGLEYPCGRTVVDVLSKTRVLLSDGTFVPLGYSGSTDRSIVRSRPAYLKWRALTNRSPEWDSFPTFEQWYIDHRPRVGRWALRSACGYFSPETCGFDNRLDLPVVGVPLRGGVYKR